MAYERIVGDIPVKEFLETLDFMIEKRITNLFLKYLPELKNYINAVKPKDEELFSSKKVCESLRITRQTLHNWYKDESKIDLLDKTIIKKGGRNFYYLYKLKIVVENNQELFGKGRLYAYKFEATEMVEKKINEDVNDIVNKRLSILTLKEVNKKMQSYESLTDSELKLYRDSEI